MTKMAKVLFIRDFEEHKAGEVVEMTASQLFYFQELDCIEVLEAPSPEPAVPSKPKKEKKAK
jgi:hypothetical protein